MNLPNYKNNILNISNSILKHYNVKTLYATHALLDKYLEKNYKHVMLILLDGLGINVINEHLDENNLLKRHLKQEIDSVFPPTTVAATNTVLSGLPPYASGYIGWIQYNRFAKAHEEVFLNTDYYNEENVLKSNLKADYLKYNSIMRQIEDQNSDLKVYRLFPKFDLINGYYTFGDQVNRLIEISKGDKSFSYCYFDEPDSTLHQYGVYDTNTNQIVKHLNNEYERLIMNVSPDTLVITIADHGFSNVEPIDLFEYNDLISLLSEKPSLESRALTFFVKENLHNKFEKLFNSYFEKDFVLLSYDELIDSNLLGTGIKHPLLDDFIGDYIAIAISNKYFKLKAGTNFKGHHAGLTKDELKVPLIINKAIKE